MHSLTKKDLVSCHFLSNIISLLDNVICTHLKWNAVEVLFFSQVPPVEPRIVPVHLKLKLDSPLERGLLHVGDVDDVHGDIDGGGAAVLGHGREAGDVLTRGRELDQVTASLISLVLALRLAVTHAGHGQTRAVRTGELGVIAAEMRFV